MLVLARRRGESIRIGDNVEVIVNRIIGNKVWLCINAPREIKVVRTELIEQREAALRNAKPLAEKVQDVIAVKRQVADIIGGR